MEAGSFFVGALPEAGVFFLGALPKAFVGALPDAFVGALPEAGSGSFAARAAAFAGVFEEGWMSAVGGAIFVGGLAGAGPIALGGGRITVVTPLPPPSGGIITENSSST